MNILQTIWTAMTTQNEALFKIISIPLYYLRCFCMYVILYNNFKYTNY